MNIIEKIAEIIAEKIDCNANEINAESKFEDLGIDSLDITEIVMSLEDAFEIEIEADPGLKSVSDLAALIEEKVNNK